MIEGVFMFLCALISVIYKENDLIPFIQSALITCSVGFLSYQLTKKANNKIGKREGFLIVSLVWLVLSVFGSLPYLLGGYLNSFIDAFFETMSGFTTTGSSVITNIEALPHGILMWRSLTHLLGGMGILVLTVAILPIFGVGGMSVYSAEAAGITTEKLHPRIKETAQNLWGIYMFLIFVETIFLMFGGMNLFDSICHSFATIASGGFSTRNDSAISMSPYIQYVLIFFMFLAGTNFTLHYLALTGKFKKVIRNTELRVYFLIICIITIIITCSLVIDDNYYVEKAFRDSLFQVVSVITSTGFVSADYTAWHHSLWYLIFALMFVGACVGSTSGGIKILRHILLFKNSMIEFKRMLHPSAIIPVHYNGNSIEKSIIFKVLAFVLFYITIFALASFILLVLGLDFLSSIGAVATCMGGIGPGLGCVGPLNNFAELGFLAKCLLSFLMLLGRLELFTLLIIFVPSFWRDN